ncbi:MAG: PhoH family protein, partial [Caldilinea sp.]
MPPRMTQLAQPYSVIVPGAHLMAALVGQRDAHLRLIEDSFPECTIVVRGNEIHLAGAQAEVVGRLCEE